MSDHKALSNPLPFLSALTRPWKSIIVSDTERFKLSISETMFLSSTSLCFLQNNIIEYLCYSFINSSIEHSMHFKRSSATVCCWSQYYNYIHPFFQEHISLVINYSKSLHLFRNPLYAYQKRIRYLSTKNSKQFFYTVSNHTITINYCRKRVFTI